MVTTEKTLCDNPAPGVEVVTRTECGVHTTTIHGGRLDGDVFTTRRDRDSQHYRACLLARMTGWERRRFRVF